ncbi:MAG TPA: DUF2804 family protein, partial [Anaeromyxobacteraceae bacterium]|nr:DUF2804 family protein [Anaeromyxobacteraceae bacterium]
MPPALELFHRIAEPESATARRAVGELGLGDRVAFRNVEFASHAEALAAHGGGTTPALWDGAVLHAGLEAVLAALHTVRPLRQGSGRTDREEPAGPGSARTASPEPVRGEPVEPRTGGLPQAPDEAIDPDGTPLLGAYAGALSRVALERRIAPGLRGRFAHLGRAKRWCYAIVVSDDVLAAAAVVEAGYFAGAFAWAVDRRTGAILADRSATGLPRVNGRVDDRPADGDARFSGGGLHVRVRAHADRWRFEVRLGDALRL